MISSIENVSLHDCLFKDRANYIKWVSSFYEDFVKVHSKRIGRVAGVMTPNVLNIDDEIKGEFFSWLQGKGVRL